jgi:hypothetical protein
MTIWLNSEQLKDMTGKSLVTAQRIIKNHAIAYPLCVRKVKLVGSRPFYEVLWDTTTNQPATSAEGDYFEQSTAGFSAAGIKGASEGVGIDEAEQDRLPAISDGNEQHRSRAEKTNLITGNDHVRTTIREMESVVIQSGETAAKNGSTDATLATRDISGPTESDSESARGLCSGVQSVQHSRTAESGRDFHIDDATATPLVVSSALSLSEQAAVEESAVFSEAQARDGVQVPQGRIAEVIPFSGEAMVGELVVANGIDPQGNWDEMAKDAEPVYTFEDLLYRHLLGRNPASKRTLKCKYTKQYTETGIIPPVLFANGVDGRKGRSGLKSTLPEDIKNRFEAMIKERADKEAATFRTKRHRRVTVMHRALEKELDQVIAIHKLTNFLKSRPDLKTLIKMEDAEKITNKTPSAFPMIPVGNVIMMDGVEADYFELVGGDLIKKPLKPVWIELFDTGSRKLMAMHAYGSESNENSADIFNRFIRGNDFAHQYMHIRPDNAKGFLNLKHVLHELNQHCKATKGGFTFIDDYARPLKPKDKAHLESSHRLFHDWEDVVITHYEQLGRVVGRRSATRRISNKVVDITITQIDVTLEEFNASGLTQDYVNFHNYNDKHRFTEDGVQKIWSPAQRWDAHIESYMMANDGEVLRFGEAESRLVMIHGCRKHDATIGKDGTITFQRQKYSVAPELLEQGLWSRHASTAVKVGRLSDDSLAVFTPKEDGKFIAEATVIIGAVKPQHIAEKETAKIEKVHEKTERSQMIERCNAHGFVFNSAFEIEQLIAKGLTLALTDHLLANPKDQNQYTRYKGKTSASLFRADFFAHLAANKTITPYKEGKES